MEGSLSSQTSFKTCLAGFLPCCIRGLRRYFSSIVALYHPVVMRYWVDPVCDPSAKQHSNLRLLEPLQNLFGFVSHCESGIRTLPFCKTIRIHIDEFCFHRDA